MNGSFQFYFTIGECDYRKNLAALLPDEPNLLFPASSFIPRNFRIPRMPDGYAGYKAADSGGFVASFKHGGNYQYTVEQYVKWLEAWRPDWAATMDFCCEDEITSGKAGIVAERQRKTTEMAELFFAQYRDCPWVWVPTIQGWQPADYERHATELAQLIKKMQAFYAERGQSHLFRVGVGTLCRRASVRMIIDITLKVSALLPDVSLHLWGIKLDTFKSRFALPTTVLSSDSAAFNGNFGKSAKAYKSSGVSRTTYNLTHSLPVYRNKIEKALEKPKQYLMF